ncbi:MAG: hypothetical protein R6V27_07995 [Balneolaceae bacterium]
MRFHYLFVCLILTLALYSEPLSGQPADSFDRDIRIAEGIIAELFEPEDSRRPSRGRHIRDVTGRYIPDYGIHFNVGATLSPAAVRVVLQGHAEIQVDDNSEPQQLQEMGREFVEDRLTDYLKNYASLFRDLPGDEVVRVTVSPYRPGAHSFIVFPGSSDSRRPGVHLTVWASASDIRAYDAGSISEEEFERRIDSIDLTEQEQERDQTVFASILQTALDDVSDQIRVRQSPVSEYLPGLGLSYRVHASLRSGSWFNIDNLQINEFKIENDSLSIDLSDIAKDIDFDNLSSFASRVDSIFGLQNGSVPSDSQMKSLRELRQQINHQKDTFSDEEIREMVDQFHDELIRTLRDYGVTLRSLDDDEMLIVSVFWSGRHAALPQRSELRIRKSDLLNGTRPEIEEYSR